jgi:hypothetical protein
MYKERSKRNNKCKNTFQNKHKRQMWVMNIEFIHFFNSRMFQETNCATMTTQSSAPLLLYVNKTQFVLWELLYWVVQLFVHKTQEGSCWFKGLCLGMPMKHVTANSCARPTATCFCNIQTSQLHFYLKTFFS